MNIDEKDFELNEFGLLVHAMREAKGYNMEEISKGICSIPTLSRIEAGERWIDYVVIEALLERMKTEKSEYEFVLDEDDYQDYFRREKIKKLVQKGNIEEAEQELAVYEKNRREHFLHEQFITLQRALLELIKQEKSKKEIAELFIKALVMTVPEYEGITERKEILSDTELFCLQGILECIEDTQRKEQRYMQMYQYYEWCKIREQCYPVSYRRFMRKYAEFLYNEEQYKCCKQICDEVLEEIYTTSKLEERQSVFLFRARAQEKLGFSSEEEKTQCIKDYLTAYYVAEFYDGEESTEELKKYIAEEYGWQFIG